ncbi:hypothetical protein AK830_g9349 [Neonectria ditissima]|uniref:Myb-like domain-containing protein n=1 Tax=Neonectria ditissima TaxID=78410 RepID=A0A0P7BCI7_9HYPO|nr:hypothetical protein AK830_g9349 [Neonectria ditissima]
MSEVKKEPTAAEAMLFFSIVKNTKNKADVDWEAVALEQGFKTSEVAKVRFGQVKRKLGISSDASPAKKGAVTPVLTTPSKVVKTPRGKGKGRSKVKKEEAQDEDEEKEKPSIKAEQNESDGENVSDQLHTEMEASKEDPV